ncbi:MAG: hypothetical protein Q9218_005454 [Villophora microphyllina]
MANSSMLEALNATYEDIQRHLSRSGAAKKLADNFESIMANAKGLADVDNIVCTSLGSFTSEAFRQSSTGPTASLYHLAAFEVMKEQDIGTRKVYVQDPDMSIVDDVFLVLRGYDVIKYAQASKYLSSSSFLYAPFASWDHLVNVYTLCHPALYIGKDLESFIKEMLKIPAMCGNRYGILRETASPIHRFQKRVCKIEGHDLEGSRAAIGKTTLD